MKKSQLINIIRESIKELSINTQLSENINYCRDDRSGTIGGSADGECPCWGSHTCTATRKTCRGGACGAAGACMICHPEHPDVGNMTLPTIIGGDVRNRSYRK